MERKQLPTRRAITVAVMKNAELDDSLKAIHARLGDELVKPANALVGSLYKSITDSAFFMGRTVARILDPEKISDEEDFDRAVKKLREVMEMFDDFIESVRKTVDSNEKYDFLDIVDGLEMEWPDEDGK